MRALHHLAQGPPFHAHNARIAALQAVQSTAAGPFAFALLPLLCCRPPSLQICEPDAATGRGGRRPPTPSWPGAAGRSAAHRTHGNSQEGYLAGTAPAASSDLVRDVGAVYTYTMTLTLNGVWWPMNEAIVGGWVAWSGIK